MYLCRTSYRSFLCASANGRHVLTAGIFTAEGFGKPLRTQECLPSSFNISQDAWASGLYRKFWCGKSYCSTSPKFHESSLDIFLFKCIPPAPLFIPILLPTPYPVPLSLSFNPIWPKFELRAMHPMTKLKWLRAYEEIGAPCFRAFRPFLRPDDDVRGMFCLKM